jgi:cytidine deaminase
VITAPVKPVIVPPHMPLADIELLRTAEELLARVWVDGRHQVATALRATDGKIYTGVHLEGSCRRSSICAEGVAMATARAGLDPSAVLSIEAVVSVQIKPPDQFRIIAPCGVCRELISDYSPDTRVWLTSDAGIHAMAALDLLPCKTRRTW